MKQYELTCKYCNNIWFQKKIYADETCFKCGDKDIHISKKDKVDFYPELADEPEEEDEYDQYGF